MNMLKPGTPAMEAYNTVRKAICQQSLKPGKVLTENYLCETLGMGRSPIRAALQQLSEDGFVEMPLNRSARVAQYSQEQIRQLFSLRTMMFRHALELTIGAYNPTDILLMTEMLDKQEEAFREYDFEKYLSIFYDFYQYIISKAQNPYLDDLSDQVLKRINVYLYLYDNFYSAKKLKTLPLYRKIVRSIEDGKLKPALQAQKEISDRFLAAYDYFILANTE